MDSILRFRSKAVRIFDHTKIDISSYVPKFVPDEEKIRKDILRYQTKNGRKLEADTVESGDMVTLDCESENAKFNRGNLTVFIGRGMFSPELEEKMIGARKDKETDFTVCGDAVRVTVKRIVRTIPADIGADEMADIRKQCIDRQLDMFFDEGENVDQASAYICSEAAQQSEFALDDEEIKAVMDRTRGRISEDNEMFAMFQSIFENSFKNAVMGCTLCEEENCLYTMQDYEDLISRDLEADSDSTREQLKENYPVFEYMQNKYADYYIRKIDQYVSDTFKKILNP